MRLAQLRRLIRAAELETRAAEAVEQRYRDALTHLRSSRRLDRLARDERTLRLWRDNIEKRLGKDAAKDR